MAVDLKVGAENVCASFSRRAISHSGLKLVKVGEKGLFLAPFTPLGDVDHYSAMLLGTLGPTGNGQASLSGRTPAVRGAVVLLFGAPFASGRPACHRKSHARKGAGPDGFWNGRMAGRLCKRSCIFRPRRGPQPCSE